MRTHGLGSIMLRSHDGPMLRRPGRAQHASRFAITALSRALPSILSMSPPVVMQAPDRSREVAESQVPGRRLVVAWWHPCITDYRDGLFRRLARQFDLRLFLMADSVFAQSHAQVQLTTGHGRGPTDHPLRMPWRDATALSRLVRSSDVFVSSFTTNLYTVLGLLVARWHAIPVVVWEEMQIVPRAGRYAGLKRLLLRWMARRIAAYWVLGEPQRRLLLEIGVPPERIFRCGEVAAECYAQVPREAPDIALAREGPVVLFLGRLIDIKGVDVLLKAFSLLRQHRDAVLWIAGDGERRGALEALTRQLGLTDVVRFLGHVGQREHKAWLLNRADVLAVSSVVLGDWTEGGPLVIPEALSAGTPVVCTEACGNTTDYVRRTGCGAVVTPGDVQALATALANVLERSLPREQVVQASRGLPTHDDQARELTHAIRFARDRRDGGTTAETRTA